VIVIDVYNPQWTTSRALVRWRSHELHPAQDPRLSWRDGQIDLLPLPDQSITAVMLCQVTSEFWQRGDQLALLQEVRRILTPDGRLLFAEQCRNQSNWLRLGPAALQLQTAGYWRHLLTEAGFRIRREQTLRGIIRSFRAQKPTPAEAQQLTFDLDYE